MRITQEELMNRLKNPNNLVNKLGKVPNGAESNTSRRGNDSENRNNAGRAPEIPNAPPSIRVIAGVLANAEGNAAQVARNLNLTPGQVLYAEKSNSSVKKVTEKQVEEMALTRLMDALGLLDVDTISGEKPKDISTIAANLSRVHTNLKPKDGFGGNGVNITIYSPKLRSIDDYESIDVRTGT